MPFQHSSSAASTQLLSAPTHDFGPPGLSSIPTVIATKSALAESSTRSRNDAQASTTAPARKQHHVSFQDHPEQLVPPVQSSRRSGRNQRAPNTNSRPDPHDLKDRGSEHGSSKRSASRTSSRQNRREPSEVGSSKSVGVDSAPSSSSRHRRPRNRSDKRSERSHQSQPEQEAGPNVAASRSSQSRVAPSTRSEASESPSKKDVRSRDGSTSGKRSRQHSAQGILPDLRNQDTSRSEAGTRSQYSASSRRDRFSRSHDARSIPGESSASRDSRQLFDPRRDDPVKFASQQRSQVDERARSATGAPSPRLSALSSLQSQVLMRRDASSTSSGSQLARSPIIKPSISDIAFTSTVDPTDPRALQAHVIEIKKVYRSISTLESNLQETHQTELDRARSNMADYTPPDLRDSSYWINLISRHRDLAEHHSSFLEMTCRPELPRSVQELGEVYNLPSRLWQTGFHLMLESLRSNLSSRHHLQDPDRKAELLDHLTEFIYYAYSFYSALQESERYKSFRRAWIESLGDLSRYRMAVAGLTANTSMEDGDNGISNKHADDQKSRLPVDARIDDDDELEEDGDDESLDVSVYEDQVDQQELDEGDLAVRLRSSQVGEGDDPARQVAHSRSQPANEMDKASIGTAALGDWEWTEKETWRQTAKDWYTLGITETPNIGRLHHHLGVLSRGDDDLRALYHFAKSLIAAKPFVSARDSILTLFDQERQARRLRRDSSIQDLFLYLHGILITRVQLDDFEPVYDRFMARLTKLAEREGPAGLPQSVWKMMATINIAALFQYGADDSILADLLLEQAGKSGRRATRTERSKTSAPTAILVSSTSARTDDNFLSELPRDAEWDDPSDEESEAGDEVQVISLETKASNDEHEAATELPRGLEHAATLCFSMQSLAFDLSSADASYRSNPYSTTIATFLLSLCQSKKAFRMVERFIAWDLWLQHVDISVSLAERSWPKCLSSSYITAQLLLPEDFCLRGILGLSRHLYDRGLWRNAGNDGAIAAPQGFDNEVEVLDADDGELYTRTESAWRIAASRRRDGSDTPPSLDTVRAYRLAFVARKLAKSGRGFDLDSKTSLLSLSKLLLVRLSRRRVEEEQRQLQARIQQLELQPRTANALFAQEEQLGHRSPDTDDDDFDSDWASDPEAPRRRSARPIYEVLSDSADPSDEIQALHARSSHLRDILQSIGRSLSAKRAAATFASRKCLESRICKPKAAATQSNVCENVIPGFTVLVVDTNIIVTPGDVIAQLIESQRWTVIIPLAVITELDGLRRNDNELGKEAERAIQFLESRIRSHAKYVKVQTSRGNYLNDLSCRCEDIDFTWQGSGGAAVATLRGTSNMGASQLPLDASPKLEASPGETKSVAARNVDEVILRILAWQRDNFVDRRNLLRSSSGRKQEQPQQARADVGTADAAAPAAAHKSILLTLDRNLRLKAKSRGLPSLNADGAASLLHLESPS